MHDVVDILKECVEGSLQDLVDKTSIEIHVNEGSKDQVLSWQTDETYGLIWTALSTQASSTPISTSLDLLNRVSSPPSPLTPIRNRSPRLRLDFEVGVQ